jgi:hypothetical protein
MKKTLCEFCQLTGNRQLLSGPSNSHINSPATGNLNFISGQSSSQMKTFKVFLFKLDGATIMEEATVEAENMVAARQQFFNRYPPRCIYCIQVKP